MRGMETGKTRIRHTVFTEIARLAYEGSDDYARALEELTYKIRPGDPDDSGSYKGSVLYERAVIGERLRLAMGLPVRKLGVYNNIRDGVEESAIAEKYYEPPLINVIKFGCNKCPENLVVVSNKCQGCLERPCSSVCPKGAISRVNGQAYVNPDMCIRCGKCINACSFNAIIKMERPCAKACGVKAIHSDDHGRAEIDYSKCTSCGQCLVACPFGAISDKSQIFQTIMAIKSETPVYAILAPAFVGQWGPDAVPEKMHAAFSRLGFAGVYEAGIGADLCVMEEAADFLEEVPAKYSFMVTSCCPSWSNLVKTMFPEMKENISVALTPMVITARLVKKQHPGCKVVFVGPCDAKKLEASRRHVRSDVDFVLTFEEVLGMFAAKGVDKECIPEEEKQPLQHAGTDARRFSISGGVAQAVVNAIHQQNPDLEVKVAKATGLDECRKLLMMAKAGKYNGYLLEGMACPGGCIAGAGTLQPIEKSEKNVDKFASEASFSCSLDTEFKEYLPVIEESGKNYNM
ncbi:MAG: 4Fe-4S dicluster domain-containing protein [Bacillota bacterium]|nr:4Fe-4S dicluster domain-containing protein [Bacillota bacterium]